MSKEPANAHISDSLVATDLAYARAIVHRVAGSDDPSLMWVTLPYLLLVSHEAMRYLTVHRGVTEIVPLQWDQVTIGAARHSTKFFLDTRDGFNKTVDRFNEIAATHRRFFYPGGWRRVFDFARPGDLGLKSYDGRLVSTTHAQHFHSGLSSNARPTREEMGQRLRQVAEGVAEFLESVSGHLPVPKDCWFSDLAHGFDDVDVQARVAYGGRRLPFGLRAALTAMQCSVNAVVVLMDRHACELCMMAGLKQRYVVLYQVLASLALLEEASVGLDDATRDLVELALRDGCLAPAVLGTSGKRLRDAWVHYGLHAVPEGAVNDALELITYFTSEPVTLMRQVVDHLEHVADAFDVWTAQSRDDV